MASLREQYEEQKKADAALGYDYLRSHGETSKLLDTQECINAGRLVRYQKYVEKMRDIKEVTDSESVSFIIAEIKSRYDRLISRIRAEFPDYANDPLLNFPNEVEGRVVVPLSQLHFNGWVGEILNESSVWEHSSAFLSIGIRAVTGYDKFIVYVNQYISEQESNDMLTDMLRARGAK